ncbi:prolyl oligopeptidase family serine peptidase [uncultured Rubinisphaera sp.]|mgnify:FL=1|uniref:prolyl oligopeptidase family serine peptidase n=2 Tax=Rubinisphaera TaxID=1649490 RepID=UPI0030DAD4B1
MQKLQCSSLLFAITLSLFCSLMSSVRADGPQDNLPEEVRAVPPVGITLSEQDHQELTTGIDQLDEMIEQLRKRKDARTPALLPDIEIFARALRQNIEHSELYSDNEVKAAKSVLAEGKRRAEALLEGDAPWTTQTGLVVRGYRSRIDNTVQPYGLEIPHNYSFGHNDKFRLDLWFHGRGEKVLETSFINQRMNRRGQYQPANTFILHPYGRYSNAFKFAGEVDVLEALEHARQNYRIDEHRIAVRGFSMGGAGCWQMAVHYPDLFFAANPGAGFAETPEFLKSFQQETLNPTWYEQKLWRMYDCTDNALNLYQLPVVAYSGELDIQKQAADIMEQALAKENIRLTHIIGPETKHAIHPESNKIITTKLDSLAEHVSLDPPQQLRFITHTLKYNKLHWLTVTGLEQHWEPSRVYAELEPENKRILVSVQGVTGLDLNFPAGTCSFPLDQKIEIHLTTKYQSRPSLHKQIMELDRPGTDRSWSCSLRWAGRQWVQQSAEPTGLKKKHNLQGPVDDAFMESFTVVSPTGTSWHDHVGDWTNAEQQHFIQEWRRHFRGDAVVVDDTKLTDEKIANSNLILFGDPSSNQYLAKIIDRLPLEWTEEKLVFKGKSYDPAVHAPILIFPNPENPSRYIVLNSGFTYREYAYLNNARQVPKLPDWAIINLNTKPNALWPGQVVEAGFFDEYWR